jgi:hypothetical protein
MHRYGTVVLSMPTSSAGGVGSTLGHVNFTGARLVDAVSDDAHLIGGDLHVAVGRVAADR